jgi:CHAD domain-containing protein
MDSVPALPSLLVDEGARRLALTHLEEAKAARSRMGSSDPEALHDYRVALRRLRSSLRSYEQALQSTLSKRSLRRLRRLARGTSLSRDLEVHIAWLSEPRDFLGEAERPGVDWLLERLTAARHQAEQAMRELDERLFPGLYDRLIGELTELRTTIRLDGSFQSRSTAMATRGLVGEAAEQLRQRLLRIHGYASERPIHRARIAGKHLRYLSEPFASSVPEGEAVVERLKQFQSGLGDVHDAHVFLAELRKTLPVADEASSEGGNLLPGMETVMGLLEYRGRHAFEDVERSWLHGAAEPFFLQVEAMAIGIARLDETGQLVESAESANGARQRSAVPHSDRVHLVPTARA